MGGHEVRTHFKTTSGTRFFGGGGRLACTRMPKSLGAKPIRNVIREWDFNVIGEWDFCKNWKICSMLVFEI